MRWTALVALMGVGIAVSSSISASQQPQQSQRAVLERYCITCHSQSAKGKGLVPVALDTLDLSQIGRTESDTEIWEKVVRKVNAGVMPPPGSPHPDRTTSDGLISWLTTQLDRAAQANPNPGR